MKTYDSQTGASKRGVAVAALLAGALAIATSALFVKVSEAGPVATAFWRISLALPFLWAWAIIEQRGALVRAFVAHRSLIIAAGFFFAGDLAFWHWSIVLTSVANATLLANLAPIFVTLATWLLFSRRPSALFALGLFTALAGTATLLGADFRVGGMAVLGDLFGVVTAMFYAAYQLAVTRLRAGVATSSIMAWSCTVMAVLLLPVALASGEQILPVTATGWVKLVALAIIAQVAGQSLIAYAMAHLPATFSSVGLLFQPVMAAAFAWILLGEALGATGMAGGVIVLIGIFIAHRAELAPHAPARSDTI
ncbi:MAG: DMT family transporter [Betaproteobacteria bacterium]|nr:MAG: DMT family transporter [Betaproteobacteria bacterium]